MTKPELPISLSKAAVSAEFSVIIDRNRVGSSRLRLLVRPLKIGSEGFAPSALLGGMGLPSASVSHTSSSSGCKVQEMDIGACGRGIAFPVLSKPNKKGP